MQSPSSIKTFSAVMPTFVWKSALYSIDVNVQSSTKSVGLREHEKGTRPAVLLKENDG